MNGLTKSSGENTNDTRISSPAALELRASVESLANENSTRLAAMQRADKTFTNSVEHQKIAETVEGQLKKAFEAIKGGDP